LRPPRELSEIELRHLRLLQEIRGWSQSYMARDDERLEDYVLELRDDGCTVRQIAQALGVGSSTVQLWTKHARQRRASP
jgi:DNA-directed RNA polymerase specialized sigma24 family protein